MTVLGDFVDPRAHLHCYLARLPQSCQYFSIYCASVLFSRGDPVSQLPSLELGTNLLSKYASICPFTSFSYFVGFRKHRSSSSVLLSVFLGGFMVCRLALVRRDAIFLFFRFGTLVASCFYTRKFMSYTSFRVATAAELNNYVQ